MEMQVFINFKCQTLDIFLKNRKGAILIKDFIERRFIVRIYGPQRFLVNAIDFIIQRPRMKRPYKGRITEL